MRIYLDGPVMQGLRQAFDRPFSHEDAAGIRQWGRINERIDSDMHGSYIDIDVARDDPELLVWFISQLVIKGWGKTYGKAFRRIARDVETAMGASIIDKLGDLVREYQKPKPVKLGRKDPRAKALDRIAKRKHGPPD